MSDEANKTTAAIMAAEAARQKRDLDAAAARAGTISSDNIAEEIWAYYEHFFGCLRLVIKKPPTVRKTVEDADCAAERKPDSVPSQWTM